MSWIKRNLYFLIGSAVALALIGLAGWFLYAKWQLNGENLAKLSADYATLGDLNGKKPHPGNEKVDNYRAATNQTGQLLAFKEKARDYFQRIPPIPDIPKAELTDQSFATNFSRTISQLQRDATNASIGLPADYYFSFQAQARKLSFAPGSIESLSVQLGEVKAICDVLFHAKINAIESIRRERISPDDLASSGGGDYLPDKSITNAQAVISPYEITFRCFSQELGTVIAGFACSPCSMVVKAVNVEGIAASTLATEAAATVAAATPVPSPTYVPPPPTADADAQREAADRARKAYERRYGPNRIRGPGARPSRPTPTPTPVPQPNPFAAPGARGASPPVKTGPTVALDEKQLKVVMVVNIVKLQSNAAAAGIAKPESKHVAASIAKPESKPAPPR
jgi:hypothetical protein